MDGRVVDCVSEERFSRIKNDERYPKKSIDWILSVNNLLPDDLDAVVFVSKLWSPGYILTRHYTKFKVKDYIDEQHKIWRPRLFENKNISQLEVYKDRIDFDQYPGREFWEQCINSLKGDSAHVSSKSALTSGQKIRKAVVTEHLKISNEKIHFTDHSFSHACYTYYSIPISERFQETLVITLDAFGDNINYTARIFSDDKKLISDKLICEGDDFIIGRLYRYITLILGLKPNEHEYKVMGLAPYCKSEYFKELLEKFKNIQDIDGVNFKYINKPDDLYFSIKKLVDGERFDTICGALQAYTEYLITSWIENLIALTGVKRIALSGGVAMNVKANMLVAQIPGVSYVHVPPSPDDSSQSMGAAYAWLHNFYPKDNCQKIKPFDTVYIGRKCSYISDDLFNQVKAYKGKGRLIIKEFKHSEAAKLLSEGKLLARCCNKEEFGARALGNRSIIADPRKASIKKVINEKVKNRDFWMPFACSLLKEYADEYFLLDSSIESYKYMTLCCRTKERGAQFLEAAIHPYDETCRPQLVGQEDNKDYYLLIKEFASITGVHGLLNTSFNHHGKPIVSSIEDAFDVFYESDIDALILDKHLIIKEI